VSAPGGLGRPVTLTDRFRRRSEKQTPCQPARHADPRAETASASPVIRAGEAPEATATAIPCPKTRQCRPFFRAAPA